MTQRKAIVLINGQLQELPAGDTLTGATGGGGGSAAVTEVTLDFGSVPVGTKSFTFADAGVTTASRIVMTPSANPAPGRSFDELEMDSFMCAAVCLVDGTVSVAVTAHPGPVTGQYNFNYILG